MSTSSSPSPSLHKLVRSVGSHIFGVLTQLQERYNHSKSTVSSSDTDVDSAGYASSSGTTTPEDDTQTFHLGVTLQDVLADKSKCAMREKLTISTKHRNFSAAVKKVKRVAHALAVFKKKVCTSPSSSTKLRERWHTRSGSPETG